MQTAQRSSHEVDRSSHDRSTISATATSKFTITTASPAEQLIADIVTLFVRYKLYIFFERTILSARCQFRIQQVFARQLDRAFMSGHVMFSLYILWSRNKCIEWQFPVIGLLENLLKQLFFSDLPDMSW